MTIFSTSLLEWSTYHLSYLLSQAVSPTLNVLAVSASKISVQDLQMSSPLCSFFWFFPCRLWGTQTLPSWQFHGNFIFFLHFCCCTFHFLSCISSYSCAHLSAPLDSKNPRKSDKPHVVAIKWLNFGPKLNWDFSFFFEASFGWCRFLSACSSISAHGPNDVGEVS